jgi:hypothetical protein
MGILRREFVDNLCNTSGWQGSLDQPHVDIAVLMEICSDRLYAYPTLRPVVAIADFQEFVTTVRERVGQSLAAG